MSKRFSFEFKISGVLLVILTLVSIIGVMAYQRFSGVVEKISNNLRPDLRLLTTKALLNNLNDAELSVKSFRITADTIYLDEFYNAVQHVDSTLIELTDLTDAGSLSKTFLDLNHLDSLVDQKVRNLNDLLFLNDGFRTQRALDKVVYKIEKSNLEGQAGTNPKDTLVPNVEKKRHFDWLFKRKKKEPQELSVDTSKTTPEELVSIETINTEIKEVKKAEKRIEDSFKEKELALILKDQQLSEEINQLFIDFEANELIKINEESELAEEAIRTTNRQIAWFCAITGLFVVFMAFLIINYVRANNKYRRALKRSKREAEELANAKHRFLANMSHEIRTPMNAISGFAEQIGKGELSTLQREQLTMVQKASDHLLYLINEVLDLSKLQANKIELENIPFNPSELLIDLESLIRMEVQDKDVQVACVLDDAFKDLVLGDPYRLRQILYNLSSNAVKFTNQGSIELHGRVLLKNEDKCIIRIEVKDTGIGISKDALKRIFKEFEQAEKSTTRNFGGTGLGLSIVKLLVELHDGTIEVNSELGKGTSVIVEIPYELGKGETSESALPTTEIDQNKLFNLSALVVDDEKYNRLLLISILKKFNIKYTEAANGEEAVNELKRNDYDIIFMDIRMPVMNGIEAAQKIRNLPSTAKSKTPIIALTAAVAEEDKKKYFRAGMNGFLAKPYREGELLSIFNSTIKDDRIMTNSSNSIINLDELKNICNGDMAFYLEMLETFIEGTDEGIKTINHALANSNWKDLANAAHKISSPCKHIGATELYSILKEIENDARENEHLAEIPNLVEEMNEMAADILEQIRHEIKLKN